MAKLWITQITPDDAKDLGEIQTGSPPTGRRLVSNRRFSTNISLYPTFSHFGTVPACDGRTDGQTHDDSIYRASITSRGKNQIR